MPEPTVWFEIIGFYSPTVSRRLVSSETACYVFHPNGRKSKKADDHGNTDWFKTFAEAKQELIRRALYRIDKLNAQVADEQKKLTQIHAMEEPHVKAESNLTSAVEGQPAIGTGQAG